MENSKRYNLEGLNAKIQALETWQKVLNENSSEAIDSIRRIARSLRGSELTYGFSKISEAAAKLETASEDKLSTILKEFIHLLRDTTSDIEVKKVSILIVEDNLEESMLLQAILTSEKHDILIAETATKANTIMEENDMSLVLLDLMLPDTDGRNFLVKIRENTSTADIPVIVLSGKSSPQIETECFALGADEYFVKPLDPELISTAVFAKLQHEEEIKRESRIDVLTELPNRASFHERYQRALTFSTRHREPLSLAIINLDRFKSINDTYGHFVGDELLRLASHRLLKSLRKSEFLARWGGDEFVTLFPNTNLEVCKDSLEQALKSFANRPFKTKDGIDISVTFSAGVAEVEENFSVEDAIMKADRFLYLAKDLGRNRVVIEQERIVIKPKKILLAEDDDLTSDFIKHRLGKAGFEVLHFSDGTEAFKAASTQTPDLAILNVKMPGMDGFELLRRLRELPAFTEVPIAMLTSMGSEDDVAQGLELGADDYILKPFSPSELLARVQRLLKK